MTQVHVWPTVTSSTPETTAVEFMKKRSTVTKTFLAGSISGCCSTLLFQPLDLVKTRLQTLPSSAPVILAGSNGVSLPLPARSSGIAGLMFNVVRNDTVFGLWKGLTPTLYRTVPGVGLYFATLHTMKSYWQNEPTFYENLCLGFAARSVAGVTLLPVTVIKARFESGRFNYSNVSQALLTIWRVEGVKGLFSGCVATIARDAPFSGLYLMFYNQGKKTAANVMNGPAGPNVHFTVGIASGLLASVITQPADVIKTQMQLYPSRYQSTLHCLRVVIGAYGVSSLFKGMLPRCMRRTLISALSWTVFEQLMKSLHLKV